MDPMVQSQLKDWVLIFAMLLMTVWGLYIVTIFVRRKHQSTMQKALLDKFASAHDFAEFMQSPAGQKYVMSFADAVTSPRNAILKSVQIGIVLVFVGVGFLSAGGGPYVLLTEGFGGLFVSVGFGFLISALVSYFLSRKLDSKFKE
ncbi:MAG TPA: hypothetical protein VJV96_18200 [Candidatus Angelobacter sp.]|jgi:hypothetical protein|nr:hypothetical protein [Candidatus Angelobacter sp.]